MHLESIRIFNCFGFRDSGEVSLKTDKNLVYLLGRNSSGKTSFLSALRHLEVDRTPSEHANFINYNPTREQSKILAKFSTGHEDVFKIDDLMERFSERLKRHGITQNELASNNNLKRLCQETERVYTNLFEQLFGSQKSIWVERYRNGDYVFLNHPGEYRRYEKRKNGITALLASTFPNTKFRRPNNQEISVPVTFQTIENSIFWQFPRIFLFDDQFSLSDDLPDRIDEGLLKRGEMNPVEQAFISYLGKETVSRFLIANDPDERQDLLGALQCKADEICEKINRTGKEFSRPVPLLDLVLHEKNGIQLTLKVDGKRSFYRHLSENTKFLFAYHAHTMNLSFSGDILLFDEPNTGFHASAQRYILEFLLSLGAQGNLIVVATHSEHLIDLDCLPGVRLMASDAKGALRVNNHPYKRARRKGDYLALQPVLDAVGLQYGSSLKLQQEVVLTEGVTDLLYLRGFNSRLGIVRRLRIAPARSDAHILTLIPFFIAQGVKLKIILDSGKIKSKLESAYGLTDEFVCEVPIPEDFKLQTNRSGIEDLFTKNDFKKILLQCTVPVDTRRFSRVSNSQYMKGHPAKRIVAHEFCDKSGFKDIQFEDASMENFRAVLQFCKSNKWFSL